MNRYSFAEQDKRWDGKRVYKSLLYPVIPVAYNDIYVITNEVSTFDALANKYYKDPTLWWILAQANNLGNGRLSVPAGIQLRIPQNIYNIIGDFKLLNS
jgi:hypothetical protein